MNTKQQLSFLIHLAFYATLLILFLYFFKKLISFLTPFIIGFLIAYILKTLTQKIKIAHRFIPFLLSLFYLLLLCILLIMAVKLYYSITILLLKWPTFSLTLQSLIDPKMIQIATPLLQSLNQLITFFITQLLNFIKTLPNIMLNCFLILFSSFLFATDYHKIIQFIMNQLTFNQQITLIKIKQVIFDTLYSLFIAYLKLIILTFIQLVLGFLILRIHNLLAIALFIAIFDILPILGCGTILIPWIFYLLLINQTKTAIGMLLLYLIITIVRNIVEPKIISSQIGLPPLLTLLCMYLGMQYLGFYGLVILPVILIVLIRLNEEKIIHLYKKETS